MNTSVQLRNLRWPEDRKALQALDTSFTTDRIYQVVWTESACKLIEQVVIPPLNKTYPLADEIDDLPQYHDVAIAESAESVAGFAALRIGNWNRRAELQHLYVVPAYRGRGIGRMLMSDAIAAARRLNARCLWVETQNVNYPAIRFYRRLGFRWRGVDESLYDPLHGAVNETALYFVRDLEALHPPTRI